MWKYVYGCFCRMKMEFYQGAFPVALLPSANKAALKSMEDTTKQKRRGEYGKYSSKVRAEIGRRAAEFGITATIKKYYEIVNRLR